MVLRIEYPGGWALQLIHYLDLTNNLSMLAACDKPYKNPPGASRNDP